jgi:uncharacterized protein (DUF427 family)
MLSGAAAFAAMWRPSRAASAGARRAQPVGAGRAGAPLSPVPARSASACRPLARGWSARHETGGPRRRRRARKRVGLSAPAVAEAVGYHVRIEHRGLVLADTRAAVRTLETSHPPSYYLPQSDIVMSALRAHRRGSFANGRGRRSITMSRSRGRSCRTCAWSYPTPTRAFDTAARSHRLLRRAVRRLLRRWRARRGPAAAASMAAGSRPTWRAVQGRAGQPLL